MDALLVFITLAIAMGVIARQLAVTRRDLRDVREQLARQQRDIEHLRPERPPQVGRSTSGKPPPPETATPPVISSAPGPVPAAAALLAKRQPLRPTLAAPSTRPEEEARTPQAARIESVPAALPAASTRPTLARAVSRIDWEQFLGVRLFAWVGGFALFLALAFFIKYSFDNNLISPAMRIGLGFLSGLGLVVGGLVLRRKAYAVTAQTLVATGIVTLYATCFAGHSVYDFTGVTTTFGFMVLVTIAAFVLAVRMNARVVAILGLVGGFLTPLLLSTGEDRPLALFGYILLLDLGLLAVAFRQRWFDLAALGALGTGLMEVAWHLEFFRDGKEVTLWLILATFTGLFFGAFWLASQRQRENRWITFSSAGMALLGFLFAAWILPHGWVFDRPALFLAFVFLADGCCLAIAAREVRMWRLIPVAGGLSFAILAGWTNSRLAESSLGWALAAFLIYGLLHGALPLVFTRDPKRETSPRWANVFPALALTLFILPVLKGMDIGLGLWTSLFLGTLLATLVGLATGTRAPVVLASGILTVLLGLHIAGLQREAGLAFGTVFRIAFFGALLLGIATVTTWWTNSARTDGRSPAPDPLATLALPAVLPFILLSMATLRLPLTTPHAVFFGTVILAGMLLALSRLLRSHALVPLALGGSLLVQLAWHAGRFQETAAAAPLLWNVAFVVVFMSFPMIAWRSQTPPVVPWATASVAPVAHFFLALDMIRRTWDPANPGWIPLAFAVPAAIVLLQLLRWVASDEPRRNTLLAWAGGSLLFLLTLVFPVQFERQWLTLGWAFEGLALVWLFRRVPHPGLRTTGLALFTIAFARLALNPAVLDYGARTGTPIFNAFLYTYGLTAGAMFAAARLLDPAWKLGRFSPQALLNTFGTVLAFILLNLEIADYFSTGTRVELRFTGSFARDMTFSIGWSLFAIVLLTVGVWKRQRAVRYAAAALLLVTLAKLFLHDLLILAAPYRIGAFFGVAIVAILASVLYQRFFASQANPVPPAVDRG